MALAILMPQFDAEGTPGLVLEWLVEAGRAVEVGQPVVRVEGNKSTLEIEACAAGVLEIVRPAGTAASPHELLGIIGLPGEDTRALRARRRLERRP